MSLDRTLDLLLILGLAFSKCLWNVIRTGTCCFPPDLSSAYMQALTVLPSTSSSQRLHVAQHTQVERCMQTDSDHITYRVIIQNQRLQVY